MNRYKINIGDPFDFRGPKEIDYILVEPVSIVHGPDTPNWQKEDWIFKLVEPVDYKGDLVEFVTALPRYSDDKLEDILIKDTTVSVGRVLPNKQITSENRYKSTDIDYWAIGRISIYPE